MLHCVHQLVTNCICLLFGAGMDVYIKFLELAFFSENSFGQNWLGDSEPEQ